MENLQPENLTWVISLFLYFFNFLKTFFFWPHACGILVPRPGIEPVSLALEARSLNHWTTREVPI